MTVTVPKFRQCMSCNGGRDTHNISNQRYKSKVVVLGKHTVRHTQQQQGTLDPIDLHTLHSSQRQAEEGRAGLSHHRKGSRRKTSHDTTILHINRERGVGNGHLILKV